MKRIALIFLALLVLIQLYRPAKNQGQIHGPEHISQVVAVPDEVEGIFQAACYDCHSNNTNYPWYAEVQPVAYWLKHHVDEGNAELNFSEFATYPLKKQDHKFEEVAEQVVAGEMPHTSYTLLHPKAKLTDAQVKVIVNWVSQSRSRLKNQAQG